MVERGCILEVKIRDGTVNNMIPYNTLTQSCVCKLTPPLQPQDKSDDEEEKGTE